MTADDLRELMRYLQELVQLENPSKRRVAFEMPSEESMLAAGLHPDGVRRLLEAPWLEEMIADVLETPEFCDPSDPPDQVLQYARDVVVEYIRKRFPL
jgi:hypothetical protein